MNGCNSMWCNKREIFSQGFICNSKCYIVTWYVRWLFDSFQGMQICIYLEQGNIDHMMQIEYAKWIKYIVIGAMISKPCH
jgi:hypothetical protein